MSTFSFDCESNFIVNKTASVKAINSEFCGDDTGGLWIADENMSLVKWRKQCGENCSSDCVDHYINTKYHGVKTNSRDDNGKKIIISGRGIINPRIIILRESKLLKIENETRKYAGIWKIGDKEIMVGDKRKYNCEKKYLLIFLDENNYPLHDMYIQFSIKGTLLFQFSETLKEFREKFLKSYCKVNNRSIGKVSEKWYTMTVFVPTFGTRTVKSSQKGPKGESLSSDACYVESYIVPTTSNWETMCVGRNMEVNKIISLRYEESNGWYERYTNDPYEETNKIEKTNNNFTKNNISSPMKKLVKKLNETDLRSDSDSDSDSE